MSEGRERKNEKEGKIEREKREGHFGFLSLLKQASIKCDAAATKCSVY